MHQWYKCLNNVNKETITSYFLSCCGKEEILKYESIWTLNHGALSFTTPFQNLRQERIRFEHRQTRLITYVILQEILSIYKKNDIKD